MLRKLFTICILFFCSILIITNSTFAQFETEQTPLEKTIDINSRVTPEDIQNFALERKLKVKNIKELEDIEKIKKDNTYKDFTNLEQSIIGKTLLEEFLSNHTLYVSDPMLVKYVATVGKYIASHMDKQQGITYTFGIIDEPTIRTYVFPGGYIFVTRGYLESLGNEAQLAASLSREIGALDNNINLQVLTENQEAFGLLCNLKDVIFKGDNTPQKAIIDAKTEEDALKPFSDPFASLDYFASPDLETTFSNKDYLTHKLLKKLLTIIPPYETIVKKDLLAVEALNEANYDVESVKDMLLRLNKKQKQNQVINRTINIENWLGIETLKRKRANKIEGRYVMMIERLNY